MKRFIAVLLAFAVLAAFSACGSIRPVRDGESDAVSDPKKTAAAEKTPEQKAVASSPVPETSRSSVPDAPKPVKFSLDKTNGKNATQSAVLSAYDAGGNLLWEYETGPVALTELDAIQEIGLISTGYLLLAGGEIICIGVDEENAGTEVWRNRDFGGAGARFDLDTYDNLYICGYYGPDLMIVGADGNTIKKYDYLTDEYWPCELFYADGGVNITYDSSGMKYRIDPRSGASMEIGPSPETWFYGTVVEVSTVDEFVDAIADDTAIVLAPGEYDLTDWFDRHPDSLKAMTYESYPPQGLYFEDVGDGLQLVISGYDNLRIFSKYSANPARIVCRPRHAVVLDFVNCGCVHLQGLVIGHTPEPGSCTGDVVGAFGCDSVIIEKCELFGCGAYAVNAADTNDLMLEKCVVHDCKYGCAVLADTYVVFASTEFRDCEQYTMFELFSSTVYFYSCTFARLDGNLLSLDSSSEAHFFDCLYDADAYQSLLAGANQYGFVEIY